MPITPYALNVKGVDFGQSVNALNTVRQMQAANQQRELNALAMQKAQSEMADAQALKNALGQYDINTPEGQNALMRTPGGLPLVSAFQKNVVAQQKAKSEGLKTDLELFSKAAGFMPDTAENYKYLYEGAIKDNPALSGLLPHWNQYKPGMMQQIGVGLAEMYERGTQEAANAARLEAARIGAKSREKVAGIGADKPIVVPKGSTLYDRNTGQAIFTAPGGDQTEYEKQLQIEQAKSDARTRETAEGAQGILDSIAYNPKTGSNEVADLINQSTNGKYETMGAEALGKWGITTEGQAAIGRLATVAENLKVGLAQGKLGSGVSNADMELLSRLVGDIANSNIPVAKRLASWDQFVKRTANIASKKPSGPSSKPAASTANAPSSGGWQVEEVSQ